MRISLADEERKPRILMHTISPKIVTKEQTSFTELLDNVEGIILDLENLHYYTLNSTGLFLWKQLRKGYAQTREQMAELLSEAFRLPVSVLDADLRAFLSELEANGLITYATNGDGEVAGRVVVTGDLPGYEAPRLKLSNALTQVTLSGSSTIATGAITATGG